MKRFRFGTTGFRVLRRTGAKFRLVLRHNRIESVLEEGVLKKACWKKTQYLLTQEGPMDGEHNTDARNYSSGAAGTAARMQEVVTDKANEAKEKVAEIGRRAVDKIDAQREPTASALGQTASALHDKGNMAANVAHRTAEKIQATADYIRENDVKSMANDVGSLVRRYPGASLAAAAVAGFLVARAFRSND